MKWPFLLIYMDVCVYMLLLLFTRLEIVAFAMGVYCMYGLFVLSVNGCTVVVCPENLKIFDKIQP